MHAGRMYSSMNSQWASVSRAVSALMPPHLDPDVERLGLVWRIEVDGRADHPAVVQVPTVWHNTTTMHPGQTAIPRPSRSVPL